MRRSSRVVVVAAIAGFLLLFPLLSFSAKKTNNGINGFAKYTQIKGAARVGEGTCATCHKDVYGNFRHSFHALQGVKCEDCHGSASLHVQGGGDVSKIINLPSRPVEQANGVCLSCHAQDEKLRNWFSGTHASEGVRCTECHQIHAPPTRGAAVRRMKFDTTAPGNATILEDMVPESSVKLAPRTQINNKCLRCHPAQRAEMSMPYHHPLREGKMTCVDCHNPHGGPAGNNLKTANVNQLCLSCHAQYRGPFMYQHPPVNENCLICHRPHGSPNTNLLAVSQPALCLQCHSGHHDGANLPLVDRCTNCHGSIHGSDVPTPSGGSRFVDKGGLGVFGFPQPTITAGLASSTLTSALPLVAAHSTTISGSVMSPSIAGVPLGGSQQALDQPALMASHSLIGMPSMAPFAGEAGATLWALSRGMSPGAALAAGGPTLPALPGSYWGLYFTPGAYQFLDTTGYAGRVGEYDSLQSAEGGNLEGGYVSVGPRLSIQTRANVATGSDFHIASQFNLGSRFEASADMRSFVQQQDNYPFYSGVISPDIGTTDGIPPGAVLGVKRTLGKAYARLKLPKIPVHVFVKGGWQSRVGQTQLTHLDEDINGNCDTCHYTSSLQALNYTTRDVGGGVEAKLGGVDVTWEHDFSSFNDRLPFPSANFGPFDNGLELVAPLPLSALPPTAAGTYYFDIPSPNQYSADTVSVNWTPSPKLAFNGHVAYRRSRNMFTSNPQNAFDSDTTLSWHPKDRIRVTADYLQQNLLNNFVPYFPLYGNMSYHEHWAGLKAEYDLTRHLAIETHYQRKDITRSNAFLWPQIYSPNNTDPLQVVPSSFGNTVGLALRYHGGGHLGARAGYEWIGTHDPGYVTVPGSNNRIFADIMLMPVHWLVFTNDTSIMVQNAFPVIARRNRFYMDTADANFTLLPNWNIDAGYSYQQNNLATFMAFQTDPGAGYVLNEPFMPYRQLTQTYWLRSAYKVRQHLGLNLSLEHNSAHSEMRPDLNPSDYLLLGNAPLVQQGAFDPVVFQQALDSLALGATLGSQVNVPQLIGQGKLYYLLPHGFDTGFLIYYGSYRDYMHPELNGILRRFTIYFGRTW